MEWIYTKYDVKYIIFNQDTHIYIQYDLNALKKVEKLKLVGKANCFSSAFLDREFYGLKY